MWSFYNRFLFLLILGAGFLPQTVEAGWILSGRYLDKEGNTILQRYFIQDKKVKFEQYNIIYTYDLVSGDLVLVDPEKLVFYKSSLQGYVSDLKQYRLNQMEILLRSIPEEEHQTRRSEMIRDIHSMGQVQSLLSDTLIITQVQDSLKLVGLPSERYLISQKGRKLEELWVTPGLKLGEQFDWKLYLEFLSLVDPGIPGLSYMLDPSFLNLLQRGFPSRRIMIVSGYRSEFQLNKFEVKDVPGYEFSTPAGCRELSFPEWYTRDAKGANSYDDYE